MVVALKLELNLKLLLGAVIGAAISIALFSVLDLFSYIYHPGELPAIRGVNGFVAIIIGAFIAGYYSRPRSLSQIMILSTMFSVITLLMGILSFAIRDMSFLSRTELYVSLLRNLILNIISVIIGGSIGSILKSTEDIRLE